jgi:curli biogenesis system outer membrane secretion channel CsgG
MSRIYASQFATVLCSTAIAAMTLSVTNPVHADNGNAGPQIPVCDKKMGTLAVKEPQNQWWIQFNLDSPESLIKVIVSQSNCFTLVDRGKGLAAAQAERALSANGDLAAESNTGKGQMRAADYILVPDVSSKNGDSGASAIGGALVKTALSHFVPAGLGTVLGGISLKSKTADVVLTLTDTRSTEQVALERGHAKKTDVAWDAGGGGFVGAFAAGGASSYTSTDIGQVLTQAYIDAYIRLVADVRQLSGHASTDAAIQALKMVKPGKLYAMPDLKSEVMRDLSPGILLYPTGEKMAVWWKATDELGNDGWVLSTSLELAK